MNDPQQPSAAFNNRHLRFVFVAFLFSASIADVGKQAIKVFSMMPPLYLPAIFHLVIAFFAISISWVYWAGSIKENRVQLKNIFSLEYLILLIDLVLVVLYFGIAESAEVPSWDASKPGVPIRPSPSAVPESRILAIVYGIYAIWDFFNDVLSKLLSTKPRPRIGDTIAATLVRSGASLVSFALALLIIWIASSYVKNSYLGVCLLNIAELFNLVLFRALKVFEFKFDKCLHPAYQEGSDKHSEVRSRMCVASVVAGIIYGGAMAGALAVVLWPQC